MAHDLPRPNRRRRVAVDVTQRDADDVLLSVDGLGRRFGEIEAVKDVSFEVPRGCVYGLVGPNGAGKSTVLEMIAGSQGCSSGRIVFEHRDVTKVPAYVRARQGIGRTFQISKEFARLTVLENLLVASPHIPCDGFVQVFSRRRASWRGAEERAIDRALGLLRRFSIEGKADDLAGQLSGGQKRILEILRAVMREPKLILLDEPLAGLHPRIADEVCVYLGELRSEGIGMLMVEHELDRVEALCDSVVVMAQGGVIYRGAMVDARQERKVIDAYVAG